MAQVSDYADQDPAVTNPSELSEEGKKNTFLGSLKDKAKGTVQKLVTKVKKGSDDGSTDRSEGRSSVEDFTNEESSSDTQKESEVGAEPTGTAELNGSGHRVSFEGKSGSDKLSTFARASAEKDPLTATPLIATPTSYGEPHTTVEDIMPPDVIEPVSVSELGEESSSNLGNIPEAKDEEKAAVSEVREGGPDSDISESFKDTFQQKDLQAIDGLPKPRGFDVGNKSVVRSGEFYLHRNEGLSDQTASREANGITEGASDGVGRESLGDGADDKTVQSRDFDPSAGQSRGTGDTSQPPSSGSGFQRSMFSSNAVSGMKPGEPEVQEAKKANEIGTLSRDSEAEPMQSSGTEGDDGKFQDAPSEQTGLHENTPSATTGDSNASQTNESPPSNTSTKSSTPTGDLSREGEFEGNTNFEDAPNDLPPPDSAGASMEDVSR